MILNIVISKLDTEQLYDENDQMYYADRKLFFLNFTFDPPYLEENSDSLDNITIDWGDSTTPDVWNRNSGGLPNHRYLSTGSFSIKITSKSTSLIGLGGFNFDPNDFSIIRSVSSWGSLKLGSLTGAFSGCINLSSVPTTLPSTVTDISYMFNGARSFTQNLSTWDVSNITNATGIFDNGCPMLSNTGVNYPPFSSAFTTTNPYSGTYYGRTVYPMIMTFNISDIADGAGFIRLPLAMDDAARRNGDLIHNGNLISINWGDSPSSTLDIYRVAQLPYAKNAAGLTVPSHTYTKAGSYKITVTGTNTRTLFTNSIINTYNQPSSMDTRITGMLSWGNVYPNITNLSYLFGSCILLTTVPTTLPSTVTDISYMFFAAQAFNGNINSWDVSKVLKMNYVFYAAEVFNQNLNLWDVSNVTSIEGMFKSAKAFNGDISSWNVSKVMNMSSMFFLAEAFNQNISSWNVSQVRNMSYMFYNATSFYQNLNSWAATKVTNASYMFSYYCPMLSKSGVNYPNFTSAFKTRNPYTGSYYGGHGELQLKITISQIGSGNNGTILYNQVFLAFHRVRHYDAILIDWGDSTPLELWNSANMSNQQVPNHTYSATGSFVIKISGKMSIFNGFINRLAPQTSNTDPSILTSLTGNYGGEGADPWGSLQLTNLAFACSGCINVKSVDYQLPSTVTDISYMFDGATSFNQDLTMWRADNITNAMGIFGNGCPMLSRTGVNYPIFSSAFIRINSFCGGYYGTHISSPSLVLPPSCTLTSLYSPGSWYAPAPSSIAHAAPAPSYTLIGRDLPAPAPLSALASSSALAPSYDVTQTDVQKATYNKVTYNLNRLSPTATKEVLLDSLQAITRYHPVSIVISFPDNLISIINNNPETYPKLVGTTLFITLAITTTNPSTGNQIVDISQVKTGTHLVVPALDEGVTIEIGGIKILRGSGTTSKQISTDNGITWLSLGTLIIIENKEFKLSGLGSPTIFTIQQYNPSISTSNILTSLDAPVPLYTPIAPAAPAPSYTPIAPAAPTPSVNINIVVQEVTNQLDSLPQNAPKDVILDSLQAITENQPVSVVIPFPDNLKSIINNNPETYPELVGTTLPIALATTTTNPNTGNQTVDITQVQTGSHLVVPALDEGVTIEIGNIKILRGTGLQSKELSTDNGATWISIGTHIIVGNKKLLLAGLGSPVVLTVENYNPVISNKPSSLFDYLFYFCYPVSFIGAIFYGMISILSIDPATIIANRNISVVINIYIGLCAIMAVFIWFNYQNPILNPNVYNQYSSKKSL